MIGRDDIRKRAQPVARPAAGCRRGRTVRGRDRRARDRSNSATRGFWPWRAARSPRPQPQSRASRDSPTGSFAPYRPRRAPRSRAADRRPVVHRAPGRGWSDSPAGCSKAWSVRQSRRSRASASETPRRCCRHGRKRPATELKSRSCDEFWGISFSKGGNLPRLTHWLSVCGLFHDLIQQGGTMSDVTIPGGRIRSFVERIENIDGEMQELSEQKKEVFSEAKGEGFDVKILRRSSSCGSRTRKSATSAKACSISTCGRWKPRRRRRKRRRPELTSEAATIS